MVQNSIEQSWHHARPGGDWATGASGGGGEAIPGKLCRRAVSEPEACRAAASVENLLHHPHQRAGVMSS